MESDVLVEQSSSDVSEVVDTAAETTSVPGNHTALNIENLHVDEAESHSDDLPSVEEFPQEARDTVYAWINQIKKLRISGDDQSELRDVINRFFNTGALDDEYAQLWACKELVDAIQGELTDPDGNLVQEFELRGKIIDLVDRGTKWQKKEARLNAGLSVLEHSTDRGGFFQIMKQGAIASRSLQHEERFATAAHKQPDQEMHEVSFHWDSHTSQYGPFTIVVPADVALDGAVFTDLDGLHLTTPRLAYSQGDSRVDKGYEYLLAHKPYVVIAGTASYDESHERGIDPMANTASIEVALKDIGWSQEQIDRWKDDHLVVANQLDTDDNLNLGELSTVGWNLYDGSSLKKRIDEKIQEQRKGERKFSKKLKPTGITTDFGIPGKRFNLYEFS